MKLSELRLAIDDEFGAAQGRVLVNELVIDALGQRVGGGAHAGEVWIALCRANDVPRERWHGRGRPSDATD